MIKGTYQGAFFVFVEEVALDALTNGDLVSKYQLSAPTTCIFTTFLQKLDAICARNSYP
ncbi:hypothetical protein [Vibrio splendidus]|jgi:hypothetical protein|uniref:hypothetical protein n=1 Tax=Vibrio splendidus TaxID=29497 RepID=UPI003D0D3141